MYEKNKWFLYTGTGSLFTGICFAYRRNNPNQQKKTNDFLAPTSAKQWIPRQFVSSIFLSRNWQQASLLKEKVNHV
jgi:hypothetical protein